MSERPLKPGGGSPTSQGAREVSGDSGSRSVRALIRRGSVRAIARLPRPTRLVWILLLALAGYGLAFNLQGTGVLSILVIPALTVETDILFQMFRYHKIRAPDASLATGLFLAVLLPPTVNLVAAGAVAVAAIVFRHVVRVGGRPVFNPAVIGVLAGALFFGMAPAWWASIAIWLVVPLGILLTVRTPGSWRLPAGFLAAYASLYAFGKLLLGATLAPQVLLLGAFDPSVLFFGLFMVPEPRTSPTDPGQRWIFAALVGGGTALLPAAFPSLAPLVALVVGDLVAAVLRRSTVEEQAPAPKAERTRRQRGGKRRRRAERRPTVSETRPEWQAVQRVGAGIAVVVLLGATALALNVPHTTPFSTFRPTLPAGGSTSGLSACSSDNASIPADQLAYLHNRLGSSVILYQDPNSGTVVFYDPVNNATVTETDLYEDFGYAEFNGDDYAVAGCAP